VLSLDETNNNLVSSNFPLFQKCFICAKIAEICFRRWINKDLSVFCWPFSTENSNWKWIFERNKLVVLTSTKLSVLIFLRTVRDHVTRFLTLIGQKHMSESRGQKWHFQGLWERGSRLFHSTQTKSCLKTLFLSFCSWQCAVQRLLVIQRSSIILECVHVSNNIYYAVMWCLTANVNHRSRTLKSKKK